MAVLTVKELPLTSGSINIQWQRTYERVFQVLCDDRNDGPVVAMSATLIPPLRTTYAKSETELDPGSFCQGIKAEPIIVAVQNDDQSANRNRIYYRVTCSYGPFDPYPKNPLEWPYKVSWGFAPYETVVWFDLNSKAIVNTAGARFGEPVVMDDNRPIISIARNEQTFDFTLADQIRDKLNSDSFLGADPGLVKASAPVAEQLYNPDIGPYWNVKYEFHFNRNGWKKQVLDCGFSQLDGSGNLTQLLDSKGQPLQDAQLLDGSGHVLASGGDPVQLEFDIYDSISFADEFNFDPTLIQNGP